MTAFLMRTVDAPLPDLCRTPMVICGPEPICRWRCEKRPSISASASGGFGLTQAAGSVVSIITEAVPSKNRTLLHCSAAFNAGWLGGNAIEEHATRHEGYAVGQRVRNRVEKTPG